MKGTTEYLPPEVYDYDEAAAVGPIDYSTAGDMWWVGGWVGGWVSEASNCFKCFRDHLFRWCSWFADLS